MFEIEKEKQKISLFAGHAALEFLCKKKPKNIKRRKTVLFTFLDEKYKLIL